MPDPLKLADVHDLIEHLQEGLHFARSIGASQVAVDVAHVETLIDAATHALRVQAPASGDVRGTVGQALVERAARGICLGKSGHPDATWYDERAGSVRREWEKFEKEARSALLALHPGDRIGGCVLVPAEPTEAARDVLAERRRQIEGEGRSTEGDDAYVGNDLVYAAVSYALAAAGDRSDKSFANIAHKWWPWMFSWWKPTTRRRDLVKAGALILAEIERLDRLAAIPEAPDAD